jgi:hypothetical protein
MSYILLEAKSFAQSTYENRQDLIEIPNDMKNHVVIPYRLGLNCQILNVQTENIITTTQNSMFKYKEFIGNCKFNKNGRKFYAIPKMSKVAWEFIKLVNAVKINQGCFLYPEISYRLGNVGIEGSILYTNRNKNIFTVETYYPVRSIDNLGLFWLTGYRVNGGFTLNNELVTLFDVYEGCITPYVNTLLDYNVTEVTIAPIDGNKYDFDKVTIPFTNDIAKFLTKYKVLKNN